MPAETASLPLAAVAEKPLAPALAPPTNCAAQEEADYDAMRERVRPGVNFHD